MSSTLDRFWVKVCKTETCWLWQGAKNSKGYGSYLHNGRLSSAHHVSYNELVGEIPEGMQTDHTCHVRHCVNPDHLELVIPKRNNERRKGASTNSRSGIRGVSKRNNKWQVTVGHNYIRYYGGVFTTLEEAEQAAIALREKLYGPDPVRRTTSKEIS